MMSQEGQLLMRAIAISNDIDTGIVYSPTDIAMDEYSALCIVREERSKMSGEKSTEEPKNVRQAKDIMGIK
jgi:hypothetical protein